MSSLIGTCASSNRIAIHGRMLVALGLLVLVAALLTTPASAAQAAGSVRVDVVVWQHAGDAGDIRVGARPADGSWPAPAMLPLALDDGVSSSGRYRYGDIAIEVEWRVGAAPVTVQVRVWQHIENECDIHVSARGSLGSWRTLGTVPLALDVQDGPDGCCRAGGVTIEAQLPEGATGAPLRYRLDPAGDAAEPGSYAFLTAPVAQEITTYEGLRHDAASVVIEVDENGEWTWTFYTEPLASAITTYEGLRRDAATLRVNAAAADGSVSDGLFGQVEVGHLVEWFHARDCFVRYRVTAVSEVQAEAPYREFGVRPETYALQGCQSGSLPTDETTAAFSTAPATTAAGTFTTVAVGGHYDVCALTEAREAVCWNSNAPGATATLPGRYISLDASEGTTCAVTEGGEAVCWGSDESADDAQPGPFTTISTTPGYTCGLTQGGEAVCWGLNSERAYNEHARSRADDPFWRPIMWVPDPPPGPYVAITVGRTWYHSSVGLTACAEKASGGFVCWKSNSKHQLSIRGDVWYVDDGEVSARINGDFCHVNGYGRPQCGWPRGNYAAVSDGGGHVCAITAEGKAECWVSGVTAFLYGVLKVMHPPDPSPARYVAISTDGDSACAVTDAGSIACWKAERNVIAPPDPPPGRYVAVSDGTSHTCALTEASEVVCWGWNNYGQTETPNGRYATIDAGEYHTCALTTEGEAVCWGALEGAPRGRYAAIAAGGGYGTSASCALTDGGRLTCWGGDWSAELPQGNYAALDIDKWETCVLTPAGEARCWDHYGRWLGDPPDERFTSVGVGRGGACGLTSIGGRVVCWSEFWSIDPPAGSFTALAVGGQHACALTSAGDTVCWAWTFIRTEDDPGTGPFHHELIRPPPGPFTAISASEERSCAVSKRGDIVCWGDVAYTRELRLGWHE